MHELNQTLRETGQEHLLAFLERLPDDLRPGLEEQLAGIDLHMIQRLFSTPPDPPVIAGPCTEVSTATVDERREELELAGLKYLKAGRCAPLLMAGGAGERLGFTDIKGAFRLHQELDSALFDFHFQKILAARNTWGVNTPVLVMVSAKTRTRTEELLREKRWYGLAPDSVWLMTQGQLPATDTSGQLLMDSADTVLSYPDGHGGIYRALETSGYLARLRAAGVEDIFVFQVDNPLIPIFDPAFCGLHALEGSQFSFMALRKLYQDERIGVFALDDQRQLRVVEYFDIKGPLRDDWRRYAMGNIAIYLINLDFIADIALPSPMVPRMSPKQLPFLAADGRVFRSNGPNAYKLEFLLFDVCHLAQRYLVMEVARSASFAPVKQAAGADSPDSARALLKSFWLNILSELGFSHPDFEEPGFLLEVAPYYSIARRDLATLLTKLDPAECAAAGRVLIPRPD